MKKHIISILLFSLIALTALADSNIDNTQKYAWSSQSGWVNFKPAHGGVTVYPDHLEGFAWSGNIGWISVGSYTDGGTHHYATAAHDWGVNNDGLGNLSGYAWSPKIGWINFNPTHQQVTINMTTGEFKGYAWAANMGWIHLSQPPTYQVGANLPVPEPPSTNTFRDTLQDGSSGPEMIVIPAGTFKMGDIQGGGSSNEKPVHDVTVARFAMGKYEVTFAEYDKFAEATGRSKPNDYGWGRGNRPVINVSWDDATAYLDWLSEQTGRAYRLPTEAQWEYAARAGTQTKYWWGNDIGTNLANCGSSGSEWSEKQTTPVGSFQANSFGLYDTVGNVWEWCADPWHSNYQGAPTDGRIWGSYGTSERLLRGGSFVVNPYGCRAAYRGWVSSDGHSWLRGFRGCANVTP